LDVEFQHKADRGERRESAMPHGAHPGADFERELAHRLGNLLQVVNGNLELLAARIEDERLRGYLANAQAAAGQLAEIAHGLVDEPADGGG
jgi:two-component sensor histidine kinase